MRPATTLRAFSAYESVRHRLPSAGGGGRAERFGTLADVADQFDVFLLDAFGVLNIGESVIPGVPERVATLQDAGKTVMVVTNAASAPPHKLLEKYKRLGYHFTPDRIVSSRQVLLEEVARAPEWRWGCMLPDTPDHPDLAKLSMVRLCDDPAPYRDVDAFLLLGSANWTLERQAILEAELTANPRPVWVGNPDIVAPRENGFSIEPGHFAHRIADATGIEPVFFGKPFANVYAVATARLAESVDPERVLMVGDSLHTDVLGAQAAGFRSALIAGFGFFAGHSVAEAIETSGIVPDFVLDRP